MIKLLIINSVDSNSPEGLAGDIKFCLEGIIEKHPELETRIEINQKKYLDFNGESIPLGFNGYLIHPRDVHFTKCLELKKYSPQSWIYAFARAYERLKVLEKLCYDDALYSVCEVDETITFLQKIRLPKIGGERRQA